MTYLLDLIIADCLAKSKAWRDQEMHALRQLKFEGTRATMQKEVDRCHQSANVLETFASDLEHLKAKLAVQG